MYQESIYIIYIYTYNYIHLYICINSIYLSHIHLSGDSVFCCHITIHIYRALWICRSTVCLAVRVAPYVQVSFTGANAGRGLPLPEAQLCRWFTRVRTVQLRVKAGLVFRFLQHWPAKSSNCGVESKNSLELISSKYDRENVDHTSSL